MRARRWDVLLIPLFLLGLVSCASGPTYGDSLRCAGLRSLSAMVRELQDNDGRQSIRVDSFDGQRWSMELIAYNELTYDRFLDGALHSWIRNGQLSDPDFTGPGPQPLEQALGLDLARSLCETGRVVLEEVPPSVISRWVDGSDLLDYRWTLVKINAIPERDRFQPRCPQGGGC